MNDVQCAIQPFQWLDNAISCNVNDKIQFKKMKGLNPVSRLESLGLPTESAPSLLSKENAISFDLPGITPDELRDKEVRNKEFKATLDEYVTKKIRRV